MRIFRSGHSGSQEAPQVHPGHSHAADDNVPAHKSSSGIREFFRFGRPRKQEPSQAASSSPIVVLSSSRPSLEPGTSRQDMISSGGIPTENSSPGGAVSDAHDFLGNCTSLPSHSSQLATSSIAWNAAEMLRPPVPAAPSSIHPASPSTTADSNPGQGQDLLVVPEPSSVTASQLSLVSRGPIIPPHQHSPQPRDEKSDPPPAGQNIWNIDQSVHVHGYNNHVNYMINSSNKFMAELLEKTIPGAAFDSSDRDPPPRCHPGTRLAILKRCLKFITNRTDEKNMLWVVGQAGVGKSAIMQNIAESPLLGISQRASIFLSVNGRNDGSKIIITLVYQLADQYEPYRQFVEHEITSHPSLLQSSMSVQFRKFLIEPFINTPLSTSAGHILMIIDGLDECDKAETQRELLRLITEICSAYPSSPMVWIIASRPEHHITSFFAQDDVLTVYEKEEILVDSNEARSDVERFLRAELTRIQKEFSLSPGSRWPLEQDFWKLASAAGGLFVYAQVVVKYIGALMIADPVSQLDDVLKVIDAHPLLDVPQQQHPLVQLDALYARLLSRVPKRIMINTRKILLALVLDLRRNSDSRKGGFLVLCNWLGITCDEAYAAIRHLGSVLDAPRRDNAHNQKLRSFHKSFIDYVSDFTRSGFSSDIEREVRQLEVECTIRVLEQAPGGIDCDDMDPRLRLPMGSIWGTLASVPGAGSNIVLTWPADEGSQWSDKRTRLEMYKWACLNVVDGIRTREPVFWTEFYIYTIITQVVDYSWTYFPFQMLIDLVFEQSRRHEFIKSGLLRRVPIKELDFTRMTWHAKLRFRRPSGITTNLSDPWNPSCQHDRAGNWGKGQDEHWTTDFGVDSALLRCDFCHQRLGQQLENWKIGFRDCEVTILLTSARVSFLEFQFIDPEDPALEWTYWIVLEIPEEKRRRPGSTLWRLDSAS